MAMYKIEVDLNDLIRPIKASVQQLIETQGILTVAHTQHTGKNKGKIIINLSAHGNVKN